MSRMTRYTPLDRTFDTFMRGRGYRALIKGLAAGGSRVGMRMDFFGATGFLRKMGALPGAVQTSLDAALYKLAQEILKRADYYVPDDRGRLRATGRIETITRDTGTTAVRNKTPNQSFNPVFAIRYGGSSAPYAFWVHENMKARHGAAYNAAMLQRARGMGKREATQYLIDHPNSSFTLRRPQEQAQWIARAYAEVGPVVYPLVFEAIRKALTKVMRQPGTESNKLDRYYWKGGMKEMGWHVPKARAFQGNTARR